MAKTTRTLPRSDFWKNASELKPLLEVSPYPAIRLNSLQDVLPHGVPRGAITELHGPRSSGRTAICLHVLAHATQKGEICAVVDLHDSFHPASATAAGVQLERLVWVRCGGNAEFALRSADLLLHAGGFGAVTLDLCEAHARVLNRIPISYWHRFKKAICHTPTALLVCSNTAQAKSCAKNDLQTKLKAPIWRGAPRFALLEGIETYATSGKVASIRPKTLILQSAL